MSRKSSCKIGNNQPAVSILWVGRLIKWKHPEAAIELAVALKKKGYSFKITIIGNGELEEQLRIMIEEKKVSDYVELIGSNCFIKSSNLYGKNRRVSFYK